MYFSAPPICFQRSGTWSRESGMREMRFVVCDRGITGGKGGELGETVGKVVSKSAG